MAFTDAIVYVTVTDPVSASQSMVVNVTSFSVSGTVDGYFPLKGVTKEQTLFGTKDFDALVEVYINDVLEAVIDTNETTWETIITLNQGLNYIKVIFTDPENNVLEINYTINDYLKVFVGPPNETTLEVTPKKMARIASTVVSGGNFFEYLSNVWKLYSDRRIPASFWNAAIALCSDLYNRTYQRDNDLSIKDLLAYEKERNVYFDTEKFQEFDELFIDANLVDINDIKVRINDPLTLDTYSPDRRVYFPLVRGKDFDVVNINHGLIYIDNSTVFGKNTKFIKNKIKPGISFRLTSGIDEGRVFTVSDKRTPVTENNCESHDDEIYLTAEIDQSLNDVKLFADGVELVLNTDFQIQNATTLKVLNGTYIPVQDFDFDCVYLRAKVIDDNCFQIIETFTNYEQRLFLDNQLRKELRFLEYTFPKVVTRDFLTVKYNGNNFKINGKNDAKFETFTSEAKVVTNSIYDNFGHLVFPKRPNSERYEKAVKGIHRAYYSGANMRATSDAINIISGLPFAINAGVIKSFDSDIEITVDETIVFTANTINLSQASSVGLEGEFFSFNLNEFPNFSFRKITRVLSNSVICEFAFKPEVNKLLIKPPDTQYWNINDRTTMPTILAFGTVIVNPNNNPDRSYKIIAPDITFDYATFLNDPNTLLNDGFEDLTFQTGFKPDLVTPRDEFYVSWEGGYLWEAKDKPFVLRIDSTILPASSFEPVNPDRGLFKIKAFPSWFTNWTGHSLSVGYLKANYQFREFEPMTFLNLITDLQRGAVSYKTPFKPGFTWSINTKNLNPFRFKIKLTDQSANSMSITPTI